MSQVTGQSLRQAKFQQILQDEFDDFDFLERLRKRARLFPAERRIDSVFKVCHVVDDIKARWCYIAAQLPVPCSMRGLLAALPRMESSAEFCALVAWIQN